MGAVFVCGIVTTGFDPHCESRFNVVRSDRVADRGCRDHKFRHDEILPGIERINFVATKFQAFVMTNALSECMTPIQIFNKTSASMDNYLDFV
jgi:hypothetical protein